MKSLITTAFVEADDPITLRQSAVHSRPHILTFGSTAHDAPDENQIDLFFNADGTDLIRLRDVIDEHLGDAPTDSRITRALEILATYRSEDGGSTLTNAEPTNRDTAYRELWELLGGAS